MQETWVRSLGGEDSLEMGKTTHSSILAWRIPWTVVHAVSKSQSQLSDFHFHFQYLLGLPRWCSGKQYTCQGGRHKQFGFDPWVGKISSGGGSGNPLQYSCLENPMDRGTWWIIVNGVQRIRHDSTTTTIILISAFTTVFICINSSLLSINGTY